MPLSDDEFDILAKLLRSERWACLATVDADGGPLAAMVAVVPDAETGDLLMHLSTLSRHTRNLLERSRVSLAVSEADRGETDPQTLARVAVQGHAMVVERDDPDHERLRVVYVGALPESAQRFGFGDFRLLRLVADQGRYVGGFARAFSVDAATLRRAVQRAASG
ncbi:MAG: pyridoxamine 5'-phosphate oxidase family protein, partial [Planctomycetes bacterium]|nr:pyridoxamine 5'-phosphate oxidase family protein [Planctomycetota bacterium]